jgi:anoctamin-10
MTWINRNFTKTEFSPLNINEEKEESERNKLAPKKVFDGKPEDENSSIRNLIRVDDTFEHIQKIWDFSYIGTCPGNSIRNYFGEKVALYFEYLSLYSVYTFILAIIGVIIYILQISDSFESRTIEYYYTLGFTKSNLRTAVNTVYSFVVIIWSTLFLEHWKRRENTLATQWGQLDYEKNEKNLPSFSGKKRRSPINDILNETYYAGYKHFFKKIVSYLISLMIVTVVIIIVCYLLYFRNWLVTNRIWGASNRIITNLPSVLNTIQIFVFNYIYNIVAYKLNAYENHQTYSSYEDQLATKIFLFQFVNSFNSLIIIGFIKKYVDYFGGCVKTMQFTKVVSQTNYCDDELADQMITIALINFLKNFMEVGLPWITYKLKNKKLAAKMKKNPINPEDVRFLKIKLEEQNNLTNFNKGFIDNTFDDYLELTIQYGFIVLFAIAFPLIPVICWFSNMFEMQVDKVKLLYLSKRPNPQGAFDIGNWFYILELMSFLAIFSNAGLLIFTSNTYFEFSEFYKWIYFMCLVFFYIITKLVVVRFISDTPQKITELQKRHAEVLERLSDGILTETKDSALKRVKVDLKIEC